VNTQPPIKTWRAGIGCLTALALIIAPWGLFYVLGGNSNLDVVMSAGVCILVAALVGPFLIGWALGLDTIPADSSRQAEPTPGPDDPIHFIEYSDWAARRCHLAQPHGPHPYFWQTEMPYTEILPGGREVKATRTLSGGTQCRGHR
jgi:hypothetical protein